MADYVVPTYNRLTISPTPETNYAVTVAELQIFNKNDENLAPLGTASQDTTYPNFTADLAIDGDPATFSHAFSSSSVWTLDLDKGYPVGDLDRVVFFNRSGYELRAIGWTITLHPSDELDDNIVVGVLTDEAVQTFLLHADPVPFTVSPGVFTTDVEWEIADGTLSYELKYTNDSTAGRIISVPTGETIISARLDGLKPGADYEITLFKSVDNLSYEQVGGAGSFSTLENLVANIDIDKLRNPEGTFDISKIESNDIDHHLDALFSTGDIVVRTVNNEAVTTTFVNNGGNLPFEVGVYSLPFSTGLANQTVSLGDVNLSFDEVSDVLVVDGVSYSDGESFISNGLLVTVYNV
ncbi:unnamed protein product [Sphacelaria rigidula]